MSSVAEDPARTPRKDLLIHLTQLALTPDIRVFAVIDGAFQTDLLTRCRKMGLSLRPLYRHDGNPAIVRGAPGSSTPTGTALPSPTTQNSVGP